MEVFFKKKNFTNFKNMNGISKISHGTILTCRTTNVFFPNAKGKFSARLQEIQSIPNLDSDDHGFRFRRSWIQIQTIPDLDTVDHGFRMNAIDGESTSVYERAGQENFLWDLD